MEIEPQRIPDVLLIRPKVHRDVRGFFMETWHQARYAAAGLPAFVQDNHSRSARHTLRGLHYQIRHPQGKLVRVTAGEVLDVAVDVRRSSRTFGQWVGALLTGDNGHQLWVPPGFAHGYVVLSESADFLYKCSDIYSPPDERTLRWDDPQIGVDWRLPAGATPILSARDAIAGGLAAAEVFP